MLKPLAPKTPVEFTVPGDEQDPTVFTIRALTGAEHMRCISYAAAGAIQRNPENVSISLERALWYGLLGWENFGDAKFDEVDQQANIDRLPKEYLTAVATEIMRLSRLHDEDKKK